jgi:hypothetical protein
MSDPRTTQWLAAHAKVQAYDSERRRLVALHLVAGKDEAAAVTLAENSLREQRPTEAERFDAVRAKVELERAARVEAGHNAAVESMKVSSR